MKMETVVDHSKFIKDLVTGENMYWVHFGDKHAFVQVKGFGFYRLKNIPRHLLYKLLENCQGFVDQTEGTSGTPVKVNAALN